MTDLENKIIPFFKKYSLLGNKNLDFKDFCIVLDLMKIKSHLKEAGLKKILNIKSGMNTGRKLD
jgi:hypothetical protein